MAVILPRRVKRFFGPFFVFAGVMHFVVPDTYESIVPRALPRRRAIVYASGVAEIAGGAGVMHPRTRRVASLWSVATLVAVFPANVNMALNADRYRVPGGAVALWLRLPVQILFVLWALAAGDD
ncbi:MAG TPA: hypothetical protein VJT75_13510 [Thermoleophilaceae bacterium]|nr:hypothetical protein [Thermoleophilaceae bacterium]